jgi:6-phosphogluconolactonase
MDIRVAVDAQAAADEAASLIQRRLRDAVSRRGIATIAVSGGSGPALMFANLASVGDLPWSSIHLWQVDERVAPAGDPARNLNLLAGLPVPRKNVHGIPVQRKRLVDAAKAYAATLPARFDIVHLGMGPDGHTASWPPGDPVIDARGPVGISLPYMNFVRVTLTPMVINAARRRLVLVTGAEKAAAVEGWMLRKNDLPIERVHRTNTTVVLDQAAAARLKPAPPD